MHSAAETLNILVVGGTGATGQHLVEQLLDRGHRVKIIARTPKKLSETVQSHESAMIVTGSVLDMSVAELTQHVGGCDAIASCLGHTLSFRGVFGPPWRLVTKSVSQLCCAIEVNNPDHPVRFVLMNSAGCRNRDVPEHVSLVQRIVVGCLRALVPPHADNEAAAAFLQTKIGLDSPNINWVVVRPDSLINENTITPYAIHASPTRSAIFNPGKTSRINVADCIAELITGSDTWSQWVGQMPVVYNKEPQ